MVAELRGNVSINVAEPIPQLQLSGEGGMVPPINRAPSGSGEAGKGPQISDEDLDLVIMLGLDDPTLELPGFEDFLDRYSDIIDPPGLPVPPKEEVDRFLDKAGRMGLIKVDRPLGIRQFLGAFMPIR